MNRVFRLALLVLSFNGAFALEPAELGLFGISPCHINNRSAKDAERWVPQMEAIGLRYYRACATGWGLVEPAEGQWSWTELDGQMDYLQEHGFTFGGMFNGNARWNTKDEPRTLPVNNLPAWSAHVTALVQHTRGRIRHWEVWNEPPNGTGRDQTPADYAKIVVSAYDAAKAVDPDCLIGLAAKSVHINYLEQAIQAGAKDHFDYITLHPYEVLNGIASNAGTEAVFMNIVPTVRRMLKAQNPAKADVPIIFTELGCDVNRGADTQAHALVKAYAMGAAQGVTCIQWFEGRDGDSGPLGLIDAKGQPRPAYTAMAQMIQHLGQRPAYLGWLQFHDRHPAFLFQGAEKPVLIAWAQKESADVVEFGPDAVIVDPLTGEKLPSTAPTLTVAPILVLGANEETLKQARANLDKRMPWGGDFTKARSVSLTMQDGQPVSKGLHTLSGDSVAQAVLAYGGSARAGNVPGGNLFIVDPGFMSYHTEPVEITIVVRRNEANDKAGFKLVYESTSGFKTAGGWFNIPDNQEWHTVRRRIDDAQFVNYWGYNFALESDGNEFNNYLIQSVTVTKVDP